MSRSTISERPYRTITLIVKLTKKLAFKFEWNGAHMGGGPMKYHTKNPKTWPWWRVVAPRLIVLGVHKPSTGRRLWLYTRWGAYYADFVLDRRGVVQKRIQGWIRSWT